MNPRIDYSNRRNSSRLAVSLPLKLKAEQGEIPAITRNVSARGIYFCIQCEAKIPLESEIEFVIVFPPEITLSSSVSVRCHGTVVRELSESAGIGVAAEIHHYEFLPQPSSNPS